MKQEKKSKEFESGNKFKLLVAIITLLQDIMLRYIKYFLSQLKELKHAKVRV